MYKYIYKYINQHVWFITLYPASPNIYINFYRFHPFLRWFLGWPPRTRSIKLCQEGFGMPRTRHAAVISFTEAERPKMRSCERLPGTVART